MVLAGSTEKGTLRTDLEQVVLVVMMPVAIWTCVMSRLMRVEILLFTPYGATAIRTAPANDTAVFFDGVIDQFRTREAVDLVTSLPVLGGVSDMLTQITDAAVAASAVFSSAVKLLE